jgi:acyl-CoA synthetase (NDP forming)
MVESEDVVEMDLNPVFVYEKGYAVADARIVRGGRRKFERKEKDHRIEEIINPETVAVIGASNHPLKVGYSVVKSLTSNPELKVYPVNPKLSEIDGLKVYPSIKSIPDKVDFAVIAVPADRVLEVVKECTEKGVKGILVISSGFKEAEDKRGEALQRELTKIARETGVRIIGPNAFGIVNVTSSINASFTPMFSSLKKGSVALVSQSGGICHYIMHNFIDEIGFSYILHLGNRCDVDFPEVLRFLKDDPNTDVVTLYIEGVDNGRELFDAISELSRVKPVIVLKAGKSDIADRVSRSHTGSLAGDYRVYESAMKQANAIVVESPLELLDVAKALTKIRKVDGDVVIAAIQAGLGFVCLDILEENGGKIAKLSEKTIRYLHEVLPPITMRDNPIDLSFSGLDLNLFREVMRAVSEDNSVGLIVFIYAVAPPSWVIPPEVILNVLENVKKPVIIIYSSTPEDFRKFREKVESFGVPVYSSVERGARVAAKIQLLRN